MEELLDQREVVRPEDAARPRLLGRAELRS
jgi:hypothetical protein